MARRGAFTLRPSDGGRLITVDAPENVGPENYVEKSGWRRVDDCEQVREAFDTQGLTLAGVLGVWELIRPNGDVAIVAATATHVYRIEANLSLTTLGSGYSATWWQGESIDGYLILNNGVDLPCYCRVEMNSTVPLYELRDVGVASARCMTAANGFLLFGNVREIPDLTTWMNGATPYGKFTGTANNVRYKVMWSDFAKPTNFAPAYNGTIQSATKNQVTLTWATSTLKVGDKLAITNAGPNGSILGGQTEIPDGVVITAISGATITLGTPADAALTYPLSVQVLRYEDTSTFCGSAKIQDDGSEMDVILPLKKLVVIYRGTSIFTGRFTGDVDMPFTFTTAYQGSDIPRYPQAVASVNGDYHVFPTRNRFMYFDGSGAPQVFTPLDNARTEFFDTAVATSFAVQNRDTKEVWFCTPSKVLAFDYHTSTVSTINLSVDAAMQTAANGFFAFVDGTYVKQNMTSFTGPAVLRGGFGPLGDDHDQKVLRGFGPVFADPTPTPAMQIQLRGREGPGVEADTLVDDTLEYDPDFPLIESFFRNVYFQDELTVTGTFSTPLRLMQRLYKMRVVGTVGETRSHA